MLVNRTESVILGILEFIGLIVSLYGLWFQYVSNVTLAGVIYCSVWYLFGACAHITGLVSIFLEATEEELKGDSQTVLQFHYMLAWLAVIVGYPLMVTYTWIRLHPTPLAQLHLILSALPIVFLIWKNSQLVVRSTQVCLGLAIASHFWICFKAGDPWGMLSAVMMVVNTVALSVPTHYHIGAFNSRELFTIGLVITSIFLNKSIQNLGRFPAPEIKVKIDTNTP